MFQPLFRAPSMAMGSLAPQSISTQGIFGSGSSVQFHSGNIWPLVQLMSQLELNTFPPHGKLPGCDFTSTSILFLHAAPHCFFTLQPSCESPDLIFMGTFRLVTLCRVMEFLGTPISS